MGSRTGAVVAALTAAAAFAALPAASGATAGEASVRNGEIAFQRGFNFYEQGYLWAVNADGSRPPRRLLESGQVSDAAWSPDGKRLAVVERCAVKIMPAAGGPLRTIVRPRIRTEPDSTGRRTRYSECYGGLDWSPDGKRLVFMRCLRAGCWYGTALYVMDASGRGRRQITQREHISGRDWTKIYLKDSDPDWSPDGQKILFSHNDSSLPDPLYGNWANNTWLYLVNPDGSGLERLPPEQAWSPRWSPDGRRIVFDRTVWTTKPPGATWWNAIVVMNADGSGEKTLLRRDNDGTGGYGTDDCKHGGGGAVWSPDGSKLVYSGSCPGGVHLMNPDGSDRVRLTRGLYDTVLDWRPLPG